MNIKYIAPDFFPRLNFVTNVVFRDVSFEGVPRLFSPADSLVPRSPQSRSVQRGRQRGGGELERGEVQETKSEAISARNARQSRSTRSSEDEP